MKRPTSVLAVLAAFVVAASSATAATVSGTIASGKRYQVIVVQSNGTGKKVAIIAVKGTFSVNASSLAGASLHLISANGSYFGPIVLGGKNAKVYETIKGSGKLALGKIMMKSGYAVAKASASRYQTSAAYTVKAIKGKPIGAGKFGRVKVGNGTSRLAGYNGAGKDADLDGLPGAFDIDDNGNLILDNVDRTTRSGKRLTRSFAPSTRQVCPPPPASQPAGCTAPTPPGGGTGGTGGGTGAGASSTTDFKIFSNFKLTDTVSVNANIGTITDIDTLVNQQVPAIVTLATQILGGGSTSQLDCLGNVYCQAHFVTGSPSVSPTTQYPLMGTATGGTPTTATLTAPSFVELVKGSTGDAQMTPGAQPAEIGSGNAFLQSDGTTTTYPGTLNFVFNTAPALVSYDVGSGVQTMAYSATGVATTGMTPSAPITIPAGKTTVTVNFWRPQRQAISGEANFGTANDWTDIGGLSYRADTPNAPTGSTKSSCVGAYSGATADGVPVTTTSTSEGVQDPAIDAAADPAKMMAFTIDLATCFDWSLVATGTAVHLDIQAVSVYGDNAARKLYFVKG